MFGENEIDILLFACYKGVNYLYRTNDYEILYIGAIFTAIFNLF